MRKLKNKIRRPDWSEYFLEVAKLVAQRSTCLRRKVGAVLVKDKRILATGYNGVPTRIIHCEVAGCIRVKLKVPSGQRHDICRGLHAEQNVLLQAARFGVSAKDSILYITNAPCSICAKMIINAGIKEVIFCDDYPDEMALDFIKEAKISLRKINRKTKVKGK